MAGEIIAKGCKNGMGKWRWSVGRKEKEEACAGFLFSYVKISKMYFRE